MDIEWLESRLARYPSAWRGCWLPGDGSTLMGVRDDGNEVLRAYAVFDSTIMPPPQAKVCVFCLPVTVLAIGPLPRCCLAPVFK